MTESMVERVARAMCDGNWDAASFNETANGEEPEEQREYWREKARAAIEAMRDPTNDMLQAMYEAMFEDKFTGGELPMLGAGFEAAIDAALASPTTTAEA